MLSRTLYLKEKQNKILIVFFYVTKSNLKNTIGLDTSKFVNEVDLGRITTVDKLNIGKLKKLPTALESLKSKVNKLDVDQLALVSVDFKKLSDLVETEVVKKNVYDWEI